MAKSVVEITECYSESEMRDKKTKVLIVIICGIIVHMICFSSIADIYFRSTVVHGMMLYSCSLEAPARRVVFIVSDGLRADNFFEANNSEEGHSPYLRSIIKHQGVWGVSHTRAPTESRPTHVAMFSGFYEDPATIFKCFESYPAQFDSIFNQSRNAWLWSSVDFVNIFSNGTGKDHIHLIMYGESIKTSIELDQSGFVSIGKIFIDINKNETNKNAIFEDKIIFFLHLQGTDNSGHKYKPFSQKMSENIRLIDDNIKKLVEIIENIFQNDHKTVYFFTSDHGMTSDGHHAEGSKNETQVPLVAWGAGIHKPRQNKGAENSSPSSWLLSDIARLDTESITIAPLLASLMGIPIPVNSMGVLPHDFLDVSEHHLSCMMISNTLQIYANFRRKSELAGRGILLQKFPLLDHENALQLMSKVHALKNGGKHNESINEMEKLIKLSLLGIQYYDNYFRNILLYSTTLSYVMWIMYLLQLLVRNGSSSLNPGNNMWPTIIWIFFAILVIGVIIIENLPCHFCAYGLLPVFLGWAITRNSASLFHLIYSLAVQNILQVALYFTAVQIMVISLNARCFISIGMLGLSLWPVMPVQNRTINKPLVLGWISSCLCLALFPLLPVIKNSNRDLLIVSGLLLLFTNGIYIWQIRPRSRNIAIIQLIILLVAFLNELYIDMKIKEMRNVANKEKDLVLQKNRILSWILSGLSIFLPFLSSKTMPARLFNLQLSLCVPLLLLSCSYEGLFFLILVLHMCSWLLIEVHTENLKWSDIAFNLQNKVSFERQVTSQDVRRTCFYCIYVMISFLGLQSLQSVVNYKHSCMQCFVGKKYLTTIKLLILIKALLFMLIPTATFYTLNLIFQAPVSKIYLIFLVITQAIAVQLQYFINNHGSWKEIGISVIIYTIMQFCSIIFALLYGLTKIFTYFSMRNHKALIFRLLIKIKLSIKQTEF